MTKDSVFKFPKTVVPMGFRAVKNPTPGGSDIPAAITASGQTDTNGTFDSTRFYGFDFSKETSRQYLAPIPNTAASGNNVSMSLEDQVGNADASELNVSPFASGSQKITLTNSAIQQRKFLVPFQYGFDGSNPATAIKTGGDIISSNTQGFDCSS